MIGGVGKIVLVSFKDTNSKLFSLSFLCIKPMLLEWLLLIFLSPLLLLIQVKFPLE